MKTRGSDSIRAAVKALRAALGFTQEGFARRLDVTTRTIARWETPGEALPISTVNYLRLLALESGLIDIAQLFEAELAMKQTTGERPLLAFNSIIEPPEDFLSDDGY